MFQPYSYIAFHDTTPRATFLWLSPAITYILGYEPEELIGTSPYDIILREDIDMTQSAHKEVAMDDLVAGQVSFRFIAKNGSYVPISLLMNVCYDIGITCGTLLNANDYVQFAAPSTAMGYNLGSRKKEFERIKRHHKAFQADSNLWNAHGFETEPRVCMILNRFTRNLIVMYASSACEIIFNIKPEQIEGKPILLFVRADELGSFVEQVDVSKSSGAIMQIRFWFQSPNMSHEIPCEAVLFGSTDGIVAVMRRCKPFVRRHLIGNGSANSEHYSPASSHTTQNASWSSCSTASSSLPSSFSMSRSLTQAKLKSIKIVDRNDGNIRPLEEVLPVHASEIDIDTQRLGIRDISKQDYVDDYDDDDNDDDDYNGVGDGTVYIQERMREL
ncbi:hypothetical protein BGZ79_007000 [Entomortierella chlamydospora]|nr:hypothetical protein BGZ79_007000 [Entomortierella chlamydospora]